QRGWISVADGMSLRAVVLKRCCGWSATQPRSFKLGHCPLVPRFDTRVITGSQKEGDRHERKRAKMGWSQKGVVNAQPSDHPIVKIHSPTQFPLVSNPSHQNKVNH